jgi:hypothetical protein
MSKLPEPYARPVDLHSEGSVLTLEDLWLRCVALGSTNTPEQLAGFLRGEMRPTRHEYNLVAVALNEYLIDIDMSPFVPYIEDASTAYLSASWSRSAAIPAIASWCDQ